MAEEVPNEVLDGLDIPEGAIVTGAFRVAFFLSPEGEDEAAWVHDGQIVLGRLLGQFEVIKHHYIRDALEEEDV